MHGWMDGWMRRVGGWIRGRKGEMGGNSNAHTLKDIISNEEMNKFHRNGIRLMLKKHFDKWLLFEQPSAMAMQK
jgi:hypothetical protein